MVVFGRDGLSGVLPGAVPPVLVTQPSGGQGHRDEDGDDENEMQQRTYRVLDLAGNTLTLVIKVKAEGHELKAKILSLQYNTGAVMSAPKNKLSYEWDLDRNGNLKRLGQKLKTDSGNPDQEVDAEFRADRNQTVITTKHPKTTTIRTGLVLLRFRSVQGQLVIEY